MVQMHGVACDFEGCEANPSYALPVSDAPWAQATNASRLLAQKIIHHFGISPGSLERDLVSIGTPNLTRWASMSGAYEN